MSRSFPYTASLVRYILALVFGVLGYLTILSGELPWFLQTEFSRRIRPDSADYTRSAILSGWICLATGLAFLIFELSRLMKAYLIWKKKKSIKK